MPELPEVETIRRDLAAVLMSTRIESVEIRDARVVRGISAALFSRKITGCTICQVGRNGKALTLDLTGLFLVVQPMMTGQLIAFAKGQTPVCLKETRIIFRLSKGLVLHYNDQRVFGRLEIVSSLQEHAYIRALGPEPLEEAFTARVLGQQLQGRRIAIKSLLLDYRVVAGVGNIYASEALFRAGINPRLWAADLSQKQVGRLHKALQGILSEAVALRGTSLRNYRDGSGAEGKYLSVIKVYGREGQACPDCKSKINRIIQQQRSTFFCERCQR